MLISKIWGAVLMTVALATVGNSTAAVLMAQGTGVAEKAMRAANPAQARAMALRAANADAQNRLLARVRADKSAWPPGSILPPEKLRFVETISETYSKTDGMARVTLRYRTTARGGK